MKYLYLIHCNDIDLVDWFLSNELNGYKKIKASSLAYIKDNFNRKSILELNVKKYYFIDNQLDLESNLDLIDKLKDGSLQNKNIIVYLIRSIDKRSKLYKRCKSFIIEPKLDLHKFITDEFKLELDNDIIKNIYNINSDLSYIKNSISKILDLSKARSISFKDSYNLIFSGVNNSDAEVFDIINLFLSKNLSAIKNKLNMINEEFFNFGFLHILYNSFRNLYIMKSSGNNLCSQSCGLSDYIIKNNIKYLDKFSIKKLNNILLKLNKIDKDIKLGNLDSSLAMDLILLELFSD